MIIRSLLLLAFSVTALANLRAADWPQFLGPARTGVSAETGLTDTFPDTGPKVVWRTPLGVGMSNLSISAGVVYTLYQDATQQFLVALNVTDGEVKWKTPLSPAFENAMGHGPRATPTISDGVAYVYTGGGVLAAVEIGAGKIQWRVDTPGSLASQPADYGMASSPLVVGDVVIVHVGSANGSVVAYNKSKGEQLWSVGASPAGYSSPVLLSVASQAHVVSFVGDAVLGISVKDGTQLWRHAFVTDYGCNTACPIRLNDTSVLISAGENHGSAVLELANSGGTWTVNEKWASFGNDSVLRAEWQTPILLDGHVYGLDNKGSAGPITNLVCVNLETGERAWSQDRFGKSNLTLADGKFFISTTRGELVIVEATPEQFSETARGVVLNGMTRQAPVIAAGHLFMRDDAEVVCIDIRKPAE